MKNKQAIRAFIRVWNPIAEAQDEGARYDRHFDGGEWSDHYHAIAYDDAQKATAERVAKRFGIHGEELMEDYYTYWMEWEHHFLKANGRV